MIGFSMGFSLGIILMITNEYLYKKCLTMVAERGGSEKILGKWYVIKPEKEGE
ncbi:hypothetical protein [Cytobacillus oceanisediminis]|uniref:hypothetical protein n=1 Tax=Cytobacillus oceanisediminis TaxID=665099 RepID=UPI001C22FB1C|nr:hypothetical protein [Cytobacillus oceanisediminis]MBU8770319.1 hypothetical protein [Cytobacillus oceanisediminis]